MSDDDPRYRAFVLALGGLFSALGEPPNNPERRTMLCGIGALADVAIASDRARQAPLMVGMAATLVQEPLIALIEANAAL